MVGDMGYGIGGGFGCWVDYRDASLLNLLMNYI